MSNTVTITQKLYDELVDNDNWVGCLEAAGVDNWEGYGYASEMYQEYMSSKPDNGEDYDG